jgi:hypothetical protein
MKLYLLFRRVYAFLERRMQRLHMRLLRTRVRKKRLLLRMLSLKKHILTNLKYVSEMLSVIILKRNVTRLKNRNDRLHESLAFDTRCADVALLLTFFFYLTLQTQIYMSCTLQTRNNMNYKINNLFF